MNRHVYRLHGKIGSQIFQLGTSSALLAPADGELELAINDADDDVITGQFEVKIGHGVKPAVALPTSGEPANSAGCPPEMPDCIPDSGGIADYNRIEHYTFTDPTGEWIDTGISVKRGEPLSFEASGDLLNSDAEIIAGPYGDSSMCGTCMLVNYRPYALYGKIGTQVFLIGDSNVILAPDNGPLELGINVEKNCSPPQCEYFGGFDVFFATYTEN